jgi:hypothetical protein
MDILNFISWIRGGRQVTTVDPAKTLLPVGLKDGRRDDDYLAGAITVQDFANLVGDPSVTFTDGSLEPAVQATMTPIGGTITTSSNDVYKKYRIQGIAQVGGSSSYALLIGVVVCSDDVEVLRVREDSVILANDTNVYDTVASAMGRSVLVRDGLGNLVSTTSTFIADDNTISAPEDHWFTLVMTAGTTFEATVVIDFTIAVPQSATVEFFN